MSSKINVGKIVRAHFSSLVNDNTGKPDFTDILSFYVLPILLAGALYFLGLRLDNNIIGILVSALSLFAGALFSAVVFLIEFGKKNKGNKLVLKVSKQIIAHILFLEVLTLISILGMLFSLSNNCYIKNISTAFTLFFLCNYLPVVLLIIKRLYLVFEKELND